MIAVILEAIWTLPLVGLILLTRRNLVKHPVWGALIGAGIGGLYAVALSFLVGPSIQTADVPFLPLAMTMGTGFGAFAGSKEAMPTSRRWSLVVCVLTVLVVWTGFYVARASIAKNESFRLVVVRLVSGAQPLHWDQNGDSIFLSDAEKDAISEVLRSRRTGALFPLSSIKLGKEAHVTLVLVMSHDVSNFVRLPKPTRGLVTYVQEEDGSWQGTSGDTRGYSLFLSPESGHTQIKIEDALGTTSTQVRVCR
jgi:hypothetical protein